MARTVINIRRVFPDIGGTRFLCLAYWVWRAFTHEAGVLRPVLHGCDSPDVEPFVGSEAIPKLPIL